MKFAVLGLLVVLLIGFFVVVWKAAREWRWFNIVAVCVTMLLAVLFLFPTAGVLKSRAAWHDLKEKLEKQAAEAKAEQRLIKYGDPNDAEFATGVVDLGRDLSKIGIEAGRRWRGLRFQGVANNQITLVAPQAADPTAVEGIPDAAAGDPAAAAAAQPGSLVPADLVVYGFAETQNPQQPDPLPTFYLGEFRVITSTPNSVTLTPTGPLEQGQLQRIGNRQAVSWSLYELLPLDAHEPFVAAGSEQTEDNFFGRIDEQTIDQLLGNRVSPETLQSYKEDGRRASDQDPPLSRWWLIEFTKNHSIDVDSPNRLAILEGEGFFDGNGRAIDSRLQRGEAVDFKAGDQVLVKEEAARALIDEDVAEQRDSFYLRPLNDYRYILRRIRLRIAELANRKTELEFETKVLQDAIAKTESMLVSNQAIKLKLEQDLAQFRVEKNAINSYVDNLRQQVDKMRQAMVRLHQQNLALEQQIEANELAIERRLNAVTAVQ